MAGNAENFAVGQAVASARRNSNFVMGFPSTRSVIVAAGIPVQHLSTSPRTVSATASSTLASATRTLPGGEYSCIRKSHITHPFSSGD